VPRSTQEDALLLTRCDWCLGVSIIVYAHLQATGLVNDHLVSCYRHAECAAAGCRLG